VKLAPVLIFAIGNESRGDDALGPLLLRDLSSCLIASGHADGLELLEDFQLQIEHAIDMKDRKLVLFIDAGMDTPSPFTFYRVKANNEPVLYSHALTPEALLNVYAQLYQETPPEAFILCIRGESFELGDAPSSQAKENLASALTFIRQLMPGPEAMNWQRQCTQTPNRTTELRHAENGSA
jgi:hydrogenase maturation protease